MKSAKLLMIALLATAVLIAGAVTVLAQDDQPDLPSPALPGFGPGMMGGRQGGMPHGGYGQGMMGGRQGGMMNDFNMLDIVAQQLDLSLDQLYTELATGLSLAEIAADYEVDAQAILNEVLAQHQAALDTAVAAGTLTAAQAAEMQANMAAMVTARFNQPWGTMPRGPHEGGGNGYGRGLHDCPGRQIAPPAGDATGMGF